MTALLIEQSEVLLTDLDSLLVDLDRAMAR